MVTSIKQIIAIIILSFVLGIIRNYFLDEPLKFLKKERILNALEVQKSEGGKITFELPENLTEPLIVNMETVDYLKSSNSAIIIDARDKEEFDIGRISGSINIPYDYYEDYEFQLDERDIVPNVYFYNVPVYENGSLNGLPTAIKIINIKT